MKRVLFVLTLAIPLQACADWEAPANPDPSLILNEARADTDAGRFEDALAKHLWFHHHALTHRRSLFGVRLSFALMYWHELGKKYPPALKKLEETRDEATKRVFEGKDKVWDAFIDMSAINDELGETDRTVAAFVKLDKDFPDVAKKVYDVAQPALVRAREFTLSGKYLEPEKSYDSMARSYHVSIDLANEKKSGERLRNFAERSFIQEAATLIALLVLNDRKSDAEKIAENARSESKHPSCDAMIDEALKGELPKHRFE